jgi:hypothetical protein
VAENDSDKPKARRDVQREISKPRLLALVFADWGSLGVDGKISVGGVFARMRYTGEKDHKYGFFLFLRCAQTNKSTVKLTVYTPSGEEHGSMTIGPPSDFDPDPDRINYVQLITRVEMPFPEPGIYWFEVRHHRSVLGGAPLTVTPEASEGDESESS